jgi:hypothetical protein
MSSGSLHCCTFLILAMRRWIACGLLGLLCAGALAADGPRALVAPSELDFGRVPHDAPIHQQFRISNVGTEPLRIERVLLTPPLRMVGMRAQVAPAADATLQISLDPSKLSGRFEGDIVVFTNDAAAPQIALSIRGEIIPPIELTPVPAFFLAGVRGQEAVSWIDIVNHEAAPIELEAPQHSPIHFTSRVETIEPGWRHRLWIALTPDGPAGKTPGRHHACHLEQGLAGIDHPGQHAAARACVHVPRGS